MRLLAESGMKLGELARLCGAWVAKCYEFIEQLNMKRSNLVSNKEQLSVVFRGHRKDLYDFHSDFLNRLAECFIQLLA